MANNNLLADFEDYRKFVTATSVFKSTAGVDRFFGYVGPNGTTLKTLVTSPTEGANIQDRGGEVYISEDSFVHPQGILAKQAIARDLASGAIKIGKSGVTIVRVKSLTQAVTQSVTATGAGRVVGAWYVATAGTATGTIAVAVGAAPIVVATATTLSNATTDKVKQLSIDYTSSTGRNVLSGDSITCTPGATGGSGTTGDVFLAIAYHSV